MTLTGNPIFPQDTPAYDAVLSNQVCSQTDQQFRRYSKNSHILIISPHNDLDTEDSEPIFVHDTSPHGTTTPSLMKMVEQFRRYRQDKIGHTERMTDRHMYRRPDVWTERVIPHIVRSTPKVPSYTENL